MAQIDTDFIPKANFLTKTLGYFKDPKVAFVGTPQIYDNIKESFIARGAAEQTYNFYGPILRGLFGMDTTLLIGANHVIRVKALQEVDHYSAHITEDLLTGMKLHSNGWKSVYVHEALALGEGPSTWAAYFSQQMRWAYGCIDILFRHSPKLFRKLNNRQKIYYFFLQQHYFSGLAMMLGVIGLMLYFGFGIQTAEMNLEVLIGLYLPLLLAIGGVGLWLQRFNVRPTQERGFMLAGKVVGLATWPIFFIALISVLLKKRLTYAVTPKGETTDTRQSLNTPINIFYPHLIVGALCVILLLSSFFTGRTSPVMLFWGICSAIALLFVPFTLKIISYSIHTERYVNRNTTKFLQKYLDPSKEAASYLPDSPTDEEKYSYFGPRHRWAFTWICLAAFGIIYGYIKVMVKSPATWFLLGFLVILIPPILVNFWLRIRKPRLAKEAHIETVNNWAIGRKRFPSVDVFLPSCGEEQEVLRNTFHYVSKMEWKGKVTVYVLDDADLARVKDLAKEFHFKYIVRENRGELKKAGNLINAFEHSKSTFITVFDADFVPRSDFLYETIPYMDEKTVGVVQTAQYFDISKDIGWIQRYAGTLQEVFFRWIQPARDTYEAAIVAGTNLVYRRKAVEFAGGFARVPIGEDVHTGVKLWASNYKTKYIQLALAKGLAPDTFNALANQQYRWCRSSMLLMLDKHFQRAPFSWQQRTSFWAAFLYYMSSAALLFTGSLPILIMLYFFAYGIRPENYIPMIPAILASLLLFPMLARGWQPTIYRLCMINSVCHLLAIFHSLKGHVSPWVPTGAAKKRAGVPKQVKQILTIWILSTQIFLWLGIGMNLPEYGLSEYWPTITLAAVQLFMLAPLLFVDYDVKGFFNKVAQNMHTKLIERSEEIKKYSPAPVSEIS